MRKRAVRTTVMFGFEEGQDSTEALVSMRPHSPTQWSC